MRQALSGVAVIAQHEIITHRYQALARHQEQLTGYVGVQEAQRITFEAYEQALSTPAAGDGATVSTRAGSLP